MIVKKIVVFLVVAGLSTAVGAQSVLLIPDSTADRVSAFSPVDGSIIDLNFIPPDPDNLSTPINAIRSPQGTIYVSDQLDDAVREYKLDGGFVGTVVDASNGLDNIRGIDFYEGNLYVTVGGNNGGLGDTIQRFDANGGSQITWATTNIDSPFDIIFRATTPVPTALVANIDTENIDEYDTSGNFLGSFVDSDGVSGIDFPEQLHETANGDILAGGFSVPAGIYRYDSSGNQINYFDVGTGVRGVYELQNGNILWTAGSGVFSLDPNTGQSLLITDDGSFRFIESVLVPEPACGLLASMAFLVAFGIRRRMGESR